MSFASFPAQQQAIQLLQRSLERGRLGHAYLFSGNDLVELEGVAKGLAKTLNCEAPLTGGGGAAVDCCDVCLACRKIDHGNHADVHWLRPEMKSRVIGVDGVRELIREVNLKPTEARYKVAILAGADRMNVQAANAFLKTLEEPPARSVMVLLTDEPQRLLETILSRCLRLSFASESMRPMEDSQKQWLTAFAEMASTTKQGLLARYKLLGALVDHLATRRDAIQEELEARSPLSRYDDLEPELAKRLEEELKAAIEAEYRRHRGDLLGALHWWLRDVWLMTLGPAEDMVAFPELLASSKAVAARLDTRKALSNLEQLEQTQRLLGGTNVQEALALEVGLLKLSL